MYTQETIHLNLPKQGTGVSWYTRPTAIGLLLVLVSVLLFVPTAQYRSAVILGAVNFAVICVGCIWLVKQRLLSSLIPVLFLAWVAAGWPLATVVFGLTFPDMHYDLPVGRRYMLEGNQRVQIATLVFVSTYLATFLAFRPRGGANLPLRPRLVEAQKFLTLLAFICLSLMVTFAFINVTMMSNYFSYFIQGLEKYLRGLFLVIGGCILYIRRSILVTIFIVLGATSFVFLVANARTFAFMPGLMILAGVMFLSTVKERTKSLMLICAIVGFPVLIVIGETTRALTDSIGFADFGYRLAALSNWDEMLSDSPVLLMTFGRLFSTGGHAIITNSPEQVPFMEFNLAHYALEIASALFVPQKLWYFAPYAQTTILNDYGFHIIVGGHSVELSMVGSFWMIGGYLSVFLGAVVIGLFHVAIAHWISAAARRSILKGAVYLAGLSMPIVWATNLALSEHLKMTIWTGTFMVLLYHLILKPFAGLERQHAIDPYTTYPAHPGMTNTSTNPARSYY